MRDLILTAFVFGSIPFILRNPFIGLLMWVWLGIMNPHRFTWGFAYSMPFAMIVALCTFIAMLIHVKKLNSFPVDRVAIILVLFVLWLGVSPLFSYHPDKEWDLWLRAFKIQFMVLVSLLLVTDRRQLHWLTWVLALSVGFFGIKGGLFTVLSAGAHRVWGPAQSFITDNNTLALALIMTVPLFRYLQLHSDNRWVRRGCVAALVLCVIAAIGSQSRGAFLALAAMSLFLFIKSRKKGLIGVLVLLALPVAWFLMPESWTERMASIRNYDEDASAMGRINAWWVAWNLAVDRFPIGGGFVLDSADVFLRYAPDPSNIKVAHSIYFQILGEHGFMGLALFLLVFWLAWLNGGWIMRTTKGKPGLLWAHDLAAMCQVSLIGYAVGGAFLSLTYFDLPYYIVVILIVLRRLVREEQESTALAPKAAPA
ncbi:MAG: putative O-glycosylation ligase, exosortase A system-associated [Rhodocyclaceae bacterium]|nr:putative O-glycosylation ligase, exosortase A system-associated [Rhodocyclaceae bacterium]